MLRKSEGQVDVVRGLLEESLKNGYRGGRALLEYAVQSISDDQQTAIECIMTALDDDSLPSHELSRAVHLLISANDPVAISSFPDTRAAQSVSPTALCLAADALMHSAYGIRPAAKMLRTLMNDPRSTESDRDYAKTALILCLIGEQKYDESLSVLSCGIADPESLDEITDAFNYSMCLWGKYGTPTREYLLRVIELNNDLEQRQAGANYAQCMALTNACLGQSEEALRFIAEAEAQIRGDEFSCWRYRYVVPVEFKYDCEAIRRFAAGESIFPAFMTSKNDSRSARMVSKNRESVMSDDEVRRLMLEYFYQRNKHAKSLTSKDSGAAAPISVVRRDLKMSHGLSAQQVVGNLTYLISQGWIEEKSVAKSFATPRGGIVPAITTYYIITAAGIDKIDGPSNFTRDRFDGIRIDATGQNIITLGDGNRVDVRFEELGEKLSHLREAIKYSDSLDDSEKLALVVDINSLQDQLASPRPNNRVINLLWTGIEKAATVAGLVDAIASVSSLVSESLR
jgi:hypothetical protein